jgi:hypothetical protein
VVPGKKSITLGQFSLHVTSRDTSSYPTETLAFKVVDFSRPYHIILEWTCYVKFMFIPSYAYLKLMIPGPAGIIIMEARAQQALDYEQNKIVLVVIAAELKELCPGAPPSLANLSMPSTSGAFKDAEDAKAVQIDAKDLAKTIKIRADFSAK